MDNTEWTNGFGQEYYGCAMKFLGKSITVKLQNKMSRVLFTELKMKLKSSIMIWDSYTAYPV